MPKMQIDYSTLNEREIKKLGVYVKPASYQLSDHMGSGCYLDAPGYPTYFIREVYTRFGNSPRNGTQEVIEYEGVCYKIPDFWVGSKSWDEYENKRTAFFKRLYVPLPEDHPRVIAWMNAVYTHFKNCYFDASATDKRDQTLIYPVPFYKLKTLHIDWDRWSVDYIMSYCIEIATYNRMIIDHAMEVATIDNHQAVRKIREIYPDHKSSLAWRYAPRRSGNWYERLPEQPTAENCPGDSIGKHPVASNYCQCCNWHEGD